jgi:hypothetical protein
MFDEQNEELVFFIAVLPIEKTISEFKRVIEARIKTS